MACTLATLGVGGARRVIIEDAFSGADATNLTAHVIGPTNLVGASWSADSGVIWLQGNRAAAAAGPSHYTLDSGRPDCAIRVILHPVGAAGAQAVFRQTGLADHWRVGILPAAPQFRLVRVEGGSASLVASASVSVALDVDYVVTLVLSGPNFGASLDGVLLIDYQSNGFNQLATRHGIRAGSNGDQFDDFKVSEA